MKRRLAAMGVAGLALAGAVGVATPATAEPLHWVGTPYIYSYNSAGLKACKAYGPRAADENNASNWRCSKYVIGGNNKYRIYVLVR